MKDKIIVLAGGGHARVLIELIRSLEDFEIIGILDAQLAAGSVVSGITVLGNDELLPDLYKKGIKNTCIGVGSIRDNNKRKILFERVKQTGFSIPVLFHPTAVISKEVKISESVQVMTGAIIQTGSLIGENTIVNTGAIVEHDCSIGKHVHICPGAIISGECIIGDEAFIGAGSVVKQGIKIGKDSIIGAGSVVIKDVPDGVTVKGVPAE